MVYGRDFRDGRFTRHHNLLTTQGKPNITGPIQKGKGKGNTVGKGHGKGNGAGGGAPTPALGTAPDWYASKLQKIPTTTGTFDVNLPRVTWTPQAVRVTLVPASAANAAETAGGDFFSRGMSDGTNVRGLSIRLGTEGRSNSNTNLVYAISGSSYSVNISTATFAAGKVTLNLTTTNGGDYFVLVEAFGGSKVLNAAVGHSNLATGLNTISLGFAAHMILTDGTSGAINTSDSVGSALNTGFGFYRNGRISQVSVASNLRLGSTASNALSTSDISASAVLAGRFDNDLAIRATASNTMFYLALRLDSTEMAEAMLLTVPPSVGTTDLIGNMQLPFTPSALMAFLTYKTDFDTNTDDGSTFTFAGGAFSGDGQIMARGRWRDTGVSSGTASWGTAVRDDGFHLLSHNALSEYQGYLTSFGSEAINAYMSQGGDGNTHYGIGLALGSGTEPAYTDKLNSADKHADIQLSSDGWFATKITTNAERMARCTNSRSATTANHYLECVFVEEGGNDASRVGFANSTQSLADAVGGSANSWSIRSNGDKTHNGSSTASGLTFTNGDRVGLLLKNGAMYVAKNGVWSGDPIAETGALYTGLTGNLFPAISMYRISAVGPERMRIMLYEDQFKYAMPAGASQWGS